jgi:hypothetical protein
VLAEWLFTTAPTSGFGPDSFGFKLFGQTWLVYDNPKHCATFGAGAVAPMSFDLHYSDGRRLAHAGHWLPEDLTVDLRDRKLHSLVVHLA